MNYDYFEENPLDFMRHQSICFNINQFLIFIRCINENKDKFNHFGSSFLKKFQKLNDFIEMFQSKIKEKCYYVIISNKYIPEVEKLLATKETTIPLNSIQKGNCLKEIKYCISFLLSRIELASHSDWIVNNTKTPNCFDAMYQSAKSADQYESKGLNEIPLSWYALYIKNNLINLPSNYIEKDYQLLFEELFKETEKSISWLQKLNDFLTIKMTSKAKHLKQKIMITKNELANIREAELNIKLLQYIETATVDACLVTGYEINNCRQSGKEVDQNLIDVFEVDCCPHSCNGGNFNQENISSHVKSVKDFIDKFSNFQEIGREITKNVGQSKTKAREALLKYINILRKKLGESSLFKIYRGENQKEKNMTYQEAETMPSFDLSRDTIRPEAKGACEQSDPNKEYIDKACISVKNHILKKFCSNVYNKEEPTHDDNDFFKTCCKLEWVDPIKNLDISEEVFNRDLFNLIKVHFSNIDAFHDPAQKLEEFGNAVQEINKMFSFTVNISRAEAGDLLPLIIFGLIESKPRRFVWSCRFIKFFLSDSERISNKGYNVIQAESSIEYINKVNAKRLHVTESEFDDNCKKYGGLAV